jgi:hypothetical protein
MGVKVQARLLDHRSSEGEKMVEEIQKWEYRVQTIGSYFGTKDENIEATLNEWGEEGWEAIHVYTPYGSGKVTIVAKRRLTRETRRSRSMPSL